MSEKLPYRIQRVPVPYICSSVVFFHVQHSTLNNTFGRCSKLLCWEGGLHKEQWEFCAGNLLSVSKWLDEKEIVSALFGLSLPGKLFISFAYQMVAFSAKVAIVSPSFPTAVSMD